MVKLSSEGGTDMTLDDMEDDLEGSESDRSSLCEDEEEGDGTNGDMEEEEVVYDDDGCNDDEDVGSGSESVNGSHSGVR